MIAIDPGAQGQRAGTALAEVAAGWLRQPGMLVAVIETGGGLGHARARRVYEKAGYAAVPVVRFFKAL
jgi:GNAT superfamily N-acetyltransferase